MAAYKDGSNDSIPNKIEEKKSKESIRFLFSQPICILYLYSEFLGGFSKAKRIPLTKDTYNIPTQKNDGICNKCKWKTLQHTAVLLPVTLDQNPYYDT